jgi:hypothetical protein
MPKLTVIVNGKPGVGKDFLCDAVIKKGGARKVSSIDPINSAARVLGWDGIKNAGSRKFLSDLKRLSSEFNDWPNRFVLRAHQDFLQSLDEILFVHIREEDQINAFRAAAGGGCKTLLIRRPGLEGDVGNPSDDKVDTIRYDFVFDNDRPPEEAGEAFYAFMQSLCGKN